MCAQGSGQGEPAPSRAEVAFTTVPAPPDTRFGPIRRFADIDSTNRYLLDEARTGAHEGAVAVADYQSAGRGRLGRRWEAPPGANLLMSVLLRPTLAIEELHLCTVAVALAAADACERVAGVVPELKWPNDLMVGGRKLAGILAEALPGRSGPVSASPTTPAVVVGLGLNVGWPPPDPPGRPCSGGHRVHPAEHRASRDTEPGPAADLEGAELLAASTSIWRLSGSALGPLDLLRSVLQELEGRLVDLADGDGRRRLASEYRRRCDTVGKMVRVSLAGEVFTGTATDVTVEGHLIVDVGTCFRTVAAGDVVHLRDEA